MSNEKIMVNGVEYVRYCVEPGKRAVVVVDRGWIFAGDVTEENGRIYLDRAINVQNWSGVGFDGMVANPKSGKVTLKPLSSRVNIPRDCELFRVSVADDWGM